MGARHCVLLRLTPSAAYGARLAVSTDADALADGYPKLMCIDQSGKGLIASLPARRFSKKVDIPAEQDTPQRACPGQKLGIGKANRAVLLRGPHIDAAEAQASVMAWGTCTSM